MTKPTKHTKLTKHDTIFDGFMHRNFNPDIDGWRNELPDPEQYPSLQIAHDILNMFDELCEARKRIWLLEKQLKSHNAKPWNGLD